MRTAVGDRYVVEAMREGGFLLGGEQSGHIIFLDHATTGDGMVAALRVLAVMVEEGRPLSELGRAMTRYPQALLNFPVARKRPIDEMPAVLAAIALVEGDLGADGRVLVRYSGTESKARVMIEGTDLGRIRAQADEIAKTLKRELGATP
jgi:phosphoglucosamine mutase